MTTKQPDLFDVQEKVPKHTQVVVNRQQFLQTLEASTEERDIAALRKSIEHLKAKIGSRSNEDALFDASDGGTVSFREDILLSELDQILEAQWMANVGQEAGVESRPVESARRVDGATHHPVALDQGSRRPSREQSLRRTGHARGA